MREEGGGLEKCEGWKEGGWRSLTDGKGAGDWSSKCNRWKEGDWSVTDGI